MVRGVLTEVSKKDFRAFIQAIKDGSMFPGASAHAGIDPRNMYRHLKRNPEREVAYKEAKEIRRERRPVRHDLSGYRAGCRCGKCTAANRVHGRENRKRIGEGRRCPQCDGLFMVRMDGRLRKHNVYVKGRARVCKGSST